MRDPSKRRLHATLRMACGAGRPLGIQGRALRARTTLYPVHLVGRVDTKRSYGSRFLTRERVEMDADFICHRTNATRRPLHDLRRLVTVYESPEAQRDVTRVETGPAWGRAGERIQRAG